MFQKFRIRYNQKFMDKSKRINSIQYETRNRLNCFYGLIISKQRYGTWHEKFIQSCPLSSI